MPADRKGDAAQNPITVDMGLTSLDARAIQTTEAHPTMEFRFLQRGPRAVRQNQFGMGEEVPRPRILQQCWAIITFNHLNAPIKRETEWRDVPLVEE